MRSFSALLAAWALSGVLNGAAAADLSSLSSADAAAGLRKALAQGVDKAVGELGAADGFFKNPRVKIDLPPKLAKAESVMRMLGAGAQADQLVLSMNRAAELAVPQGKALLQQALRQMSVSDAKQILTGGDDSATQYFKRSSYEALRAKFAPIIARATQKVQLTQAYEEVAQKAVQLGVLRPEDASVQAYVTAKTLDGLFFMMAEEERAIRKDPFGQASSLLKKVFGAIN